MRFAGSADSTIPSPVTSKRKLHDPSQPLPAPSFGSDSFDFEHIEHLDSQNGFSIGLTNNDDDTRAIRSLAQFNLVNPNALSPEVLARRLHTISPRLDISPGPSPGPVQISADSETQDSELSNLAHTELSSPPTSESDGVLTLSPPSAIGGLSGSSSSTESSSSPSSGSGADTPPVAILSPRPTNAHDRALLGASPTSWGNMTADSGLRNAIKGVYCLWAGSRKQNSPFSADEKQAFVDIVRDVMADL